MSMDSPTSMRNDSYLLTLQANFATICLMRKHNADRPDYFLLLLESQAGSVDQSEHAIYFKARTKDCVGFKA